MSYSLPEFAVVPNSIVYLEGCNLSFLKVYSEIFRLWHANKPCFLSNKQICNRTNLSLTTVQEALLFFEKKGQLKRITKNNKRYIISPTRFVERGPTGVNNDDFGEENDEVNNPESRYNLPGKSLTPTRKSVSVYCNRNKEIKYKNINPPISPQESPVDKLPSWLPVEAWESFLLFRRELKSPLTPYAEILAIRKLNKYRDQGEDVEEVINQSILNGWKGLFSVKADRGREHGRLTESQRRAKMHFDYCANGLGEGVVSEVSGNLSGEMDDLPF